MGDLNEHRPCWYTHSCFPLLVVMVFVPTVVGFVFVLFVGVVSVRQRSP